MSFLQIQMLNLLVPVDRSLPTTGHVELLQAKGGPWLAGHTRSLPRHFGHRTCDDQNWSLDISLDGIYSLCSSLALALPQGPVCVLWHIAPGARIASLMWVPCAWAISVTIEYI